MITVRAVGWAQKIAVHVNKTTYSNTTKNSSVKKLITENYAASMKSSSKDFAMGDALNKVSIE